MRAIAAPTSACTAKAQQQTRRIAQALCRFCHRKPSHCRQHNRPLGRKVNDPCSFRNGFANAGKNKGCSRGDRGRENGNDLIRIHKSGERESNEV
jgi:hypothetical protein